MMSYIQKDTNLSLILLLVGIMVVIGALTVFYQLSFKGINTKYTTKVQELNQTYLDLTSNLKVLNKTRQELELKELREGDLTGKYLTVKKQKDDLETVKQELLTIKKGLEEQLAEANVKLDTAKKDVEVATVRIRGLEETRDSLQAQLNQCQAQ